MWALPSWLLITLSISVPEARHALQVLARAPIADKVSVAAVVRIYHWITTIADGVAIRSVTLPV